MSAGEDIHAGEDYQEINGSADAFHAMSEDYRASAGIDIEHDKFDASQKLEFLSWSSGEHAQTQESSTIRQFGKKKLKTCF